MGIERTPLSGRSSPGIPWGQAIFWGGLRKFWRATTWLAGWRAFGDAASPRTSFSKACARNMLNSPPSAMPLMKKHKKGNRTGEMVREGSGGRRCIFGCCILLETLSWLHGGVYVGDAMCLFDFTFLGWSFLRRDLCLAWFALSGQSVLFRRRSLRRPACVKRVTLLAPEQGRRLRSQLYPPLRSRSCSVAWKKLRTG